MGVFEEISGKPQSPSPEKVCTHKVSTMSSRLPKSACSWRASHIYFVSPTHGPAGGSVHSEC